MSIERIQYPPQVPHNEHLIVFSHSNLICTLHVYISSGVMVTYFYVFCSSNKFIYGTEDSFPDSFPHMYI